MSQSLAVQGLNPAVQLSAGLHVDDRCLSLTGVRLTSGINHGIRVNGSVSGMGQTTESEPMSDVTIRSVESE